jgi:16S rRNA (adenine1518-N6/adenine1519-N6)-dimethyltransferase
MSLQEIKVLLQKHQIEPNKLLGQNFMVDPSVYPKLSAYAELGRGDVVLDAGAGFGFLTRFLADKCKRVVAVEKDPAVADVLTQLTRGVYSITVIEGDILKTEVPPFNKAISIPPYYLSSYLVMWLLDRGFDCAVLIVQKEFADRLTAEVGSEEYSWLTVAAYQGAEVELLDLVPQWMFYPQPQVDSIIVRLKPWTRAPFTVKDVALFRRLAKWLFTQRNKKLANALAPFIRTELKLSKEEAEKLASTFPQGTRRVRELAPNDFGVIADGLSR